MTMSEATYPAAADGRGRTTVSPRAVERLAAYAVGELDDVGGAAARLPGLSLRRDGEEEPVRVSAHVRGDTASLDVRLSVAYPASVRRTTERVRGHLAQRTKDLTGLDVERVDITVTALRGDRRRSRRVE